MKIEEIHISCGTYHVLESFDKRINNFDFLSCECEYVNKDAFSRMIRITNNQMNISFVALLDVNVEFVTLFIGLPMENNIEIAKTIREMLIEINNGIAINDINYKQSIIELLTDQQCMVMVRQEIKYSTMTSNPDFVVEDIIKSLSSMVQLILSYRENLNIFIKEKKNQCNNNISTNIANNISFIDSFIEQAENEKREFNKTITWFILGIIGVILLFILMFATEGFGASDWTTY